MGAWNLYIYICVCCVYVYVYVCVFFLDSIHFSLSPSLPLFLIVIISKLRHVFSWTNKWWLFCITSSTDSSWFWWLCAIVHLSLCHSSVTHFICILCPLQSEPDAVSLFNTCLLITFKTGSRPGLLNWPSFSRSSRSKRAVKSINNYLPSFVSIYTLFAYPILFSLVFTKSRLFFFCFFYIFCF